MPDDHKSEEGIIQIPRAGNRTKLGEAGLFGKIEFTSIMSENEIKMEICHAFMVPMGLCKDDLAAGKFFHFIIYREQEQDPVACICQLYPIIFNGMEDRLLVYPRVGATCTS